MQKHFVHFALIIMLAVAPMQTVLAGLASLEHVSKCDMGSMSDSMQADMDHSTMNDDHGGKAEMQCDCCSDCMTMCVSVTQISPPAGGTEFKPLYAAISSSFDYLLAASSQYPPTENRPPIVLR